MIENFGAYVGIIGKKSVDVTFLLGFDNEHCPIHYTVRTVGWPADTNLNRMMTRVAKMLAMLGSRPRPHVFKPRLVRAEDDEEHHKSFDLRRRWSIGVHDVLAQLCGRPVQ